MVLQKVGEYLTTIKVNGTEKVSELQSDDRTYDVTDAQGVTLKLNGETVDSYTQTSDSTYDINAYGENVDTETITIHWGLNYYDDEDGSTGSFTVGSNLDGYYGSVSSDGQLNPLDHDWDINNSINWSGQFTEGDTFSCEYEGLGSDEARIDSLTVKVEIPINPQAKPNGSTKS